MQYRVFAIPVIGSEELEEELNRFLRSHKVISVQKVVESIDGTPRWCFCVEYLQGGVPSSGRGLGNAGRSKRVDYKEVLTEEDFACAPAGPVSSRTLVAWVRPYDLNKFDKVYHPCAGRGPVPADRLAVALEQDNGALSPHQQAICIRLDSLLRAC